MDCFLLAYPVYTLEFNRVVSHCIIYLLASVMNTPLHSFTVFRKDCLLSDVRLADFERWSLIFDELKNVCRRVGGMA